MRWLPWRKAVKALEHDIDEEVSYHLERLESECQDQGLSPDAARVAAQKQFGPSRLVRARALDEARLARFESLSGDLKAAIRLHWRSPGFSALAMVTLSGGLCAAAVLFSLVDSILWRPLSYPNGERIAVVWDRDLTRGNGASMLRAAAAANYADWRAENHVFAAMGAVRGSRATLQDAQGAENLTTARVSADVIQVLGSQPLLGRWILPEEDITGNERVVVLSHGLWRNRFGGDPGILDRPIQLDDQPYLVIGVMPQEFVFPAAMRLQTGSALLPADVWLPLGRQTSASARDSRNLRVFALLKPGVSIEAADTELNLIAGRLRSQYPGTNAESAVSVVSLHEQIVASIRPTLWMLMAGVGLLVVLTCANLSSLLLARLVTRSHEMATRLALGAARHRLTQQVITENVLLALPSGLIGLAAASRILIALPQLLPADFPRLAEVQLSGVSVIFLLLVAIVSGVVIAGAPLLLMRKVDTQTALAEGGRNSFGGLRHTRLRSLMISCQMAIAVTLLIGGALLVKSVLQVQRIDPGFRTDHLLVMQLSVPASAYPTPDALRVLYPQLQERIGSLPGVRAVTTTVNVPFGRSRTGWNIAIEGSVRDRSQPQPTGGFHNASRSYFRTLGIALKRGRTFDATDTPDGPLTAVVSDAFAAEHWPGRDPLGQRFRQGAVSGDYPWITVIGVVGPVRHQALELDGGADFYMCDCQQTARLVYLVVRTEAAAGRAASAVRAEIAAQSPAIAVYAATTMEEMIAASLTDRRLGAFLVASLAVSALILASLGLYAMLSHAVAERTREIGLRVAIGASRHDVAAEILRQGLRMIAPGLAAGLLLSGVVSGALRALLWRMSPYDPAIFAGVPLVLCLVAAAAVSIPALRAARLDPIRALRSE